MHDALETLKPSVLEIEYIEKVYDFPMTTARIFSFISLHILVITSDRLTIIGDWNKKLKAESFKVEAE